MGKLVNSGLALDENEQRQIYEWAIMDISIEEICKRLGTHPLNFVLYRKENPSFTELYDFARLHSAEIIADLINPVASDQMVHPGITRNMLEGMKWRAAKLNPKMFGDKLNLEVNQTIDIGGILDAAAARVALPVAPLQLESGSELEDLL